MRASCAVKAWKIGRQISWVTCAHISGEDKRNLLSAIEVFESQIFESAHTSCGLSPLLIVIMAFCETKCL